MNENFPELSGSPAQRDQQDTVDKSIVVGHLAPGNSKQGDKATQISSSVDRDKSVESSSMSNN